jgi:hypothetical protein
MLAARMVMWHVRQLSRFMPRPPRYSEKEFKLMARELEAARFFTYLLSAAALINCFL